MMSNEEFDRRMEFFLNQQAQFDADIQQMKDLQQRTGERLDRTAEKLDRTTEGLAELTTLTQEGFKLTIEHFDAIAGVIAENSRNTDARIAALVDSQIQTEEMFRNTDEMIRGIGTKLDRHLKEDHNGYSKT
jgi:hypothetical protein